MPFDVLSQIDPQVRIDPLAALGIVPVPREVLVKHVDAMTARSGSYHYGWRTITLKRQYLEWELQHVRKLSVIGKHLPWRAAAPRSIRKLAGEVRDAIPDAQFSLGYIQNDPYLAVTYLDETGCRQNACLGIWYTRFRAVAIAQRTAR